MVKNKSLLTLLIVLSFCLALTPGVPAVADAQATSQTSGIEDILQYISSGWGSLTRSMAKCDTVSDPKAPEKSVVYLPAGFPIPLAVQNLEKGCSVRVNHLPSVITKIGEIDAGRIQPSGLLYLENPYVVPGGRFNEMYGWDSYFILRGLLREGKIDLARGMVENFFFEIEHYGGVLNANRTYYLSRSQPPFLTSMILAVYEGEKARGRDDLDWLRKAYPYAVKDYELWTRTPHLAGETGLSRYYDFGEGPVPEIADADPFYYRHVAGYFLLHPGVTDGYLGQTPDRPPRDVLRESLFSVDLCAGPGLVAMPGPPGGTRETNCEHVEDVWLTPDLYKGDRSMRESGFDISFRFGPFGAGTHHYAAVCLNSLLYKVEADLARISAQLGRQQESEQWTERAAKRREQVNRYLWNPHRGLYFDYDFTTGGQSSYVYVTTFYPLWAGLASPQQARAVAANLKLFEQPGGLAMSQQQTKAQWDYPYGWAPVHLIAIEGLRRYGYNADADRNSSKFLSMILENFRRDRTIKEKYNVVTRSSETKVEVGYAVNVIGFGWTNAAFLELLHALPPKWAERLAAGRDGP